MNVDPAKAQLLDDVVQEFLDDLHDAGEQTAAVMLGYTHSLHRAWRPILQLLPVPPGCAVLDLACGLGLLAFELAANVPLPARGVDIDPGFIVHADRLRDRLAAEGLFTPDSAVTFSVGDACALGLPDESFDLAFVREMLQFLPDPVLATREVFRVLKPGGFFCLSDTDDQLRITWPPDSPAQQRLVAAVAAVQHGRGGDRQAGRKLTAHLRAAGFQISSVVVLPEAQHRVVDARDVERTLVIEQLHDARSRVLEADTTTAERYDADLAALEAEEPVEQFRMNARIVVLAQRPAA